MIEEDNRKSLRKPEEIKYVDYECKKPIIDTKQMSYVFESEEPNIGEEGQWFGEKGRDEDSRPKKK